MRTKVLWVCAFMPSVVAKALNMDRGVKEGWVDAALMGLLAGSGENMEISVAFAVPPGSRELRGEVRVDLSSQYENNSCRIVSVSGEAQAAAANTASSPVEASSRSASYARDAAPSSVEASPRSASDARDFAANTASSLSEASPRVVSDNRYFSANTASSLRTLTYYSFPEDFSRLEELPAALMQSAERILQDARPDLIHIFGTEYPHGAAFAEAFGEPARILVSLQGLMGECAEHYRAGLPDRVWDSVTLRDLLRNDSLKKQQEKFEKRAVFEKRLLLSAGHTAGRTAFDKGAALAINPGLIYHHLGESLRREFYSYEEEQPPSVTENNAASGRGGEFRRANRSLWVFDRCIPRRIFLSQGNYPLKGAHRLLECLPELISEFPDISVHIAGDAITRTASFRDGLKLSGYGRYLLELVRDHENHVTFTGRLSAEQMKEEMLSANVFLSPSSIENSSNSLGEAMLLGVPCAASRVGGIPDLAEDGKEALLYPFEDREAMIAAICRLFRDRDLCEALGSAASKKARRLFDPSGNTACLLQLYHGLVG